MKSRILIVEDEATEAMNFEKLLKSFGYEVVGIASTGEDAIKMAIEQEPDLVLMDIVLKGEVDGIEAAAKIKEDFNIPVVYLTAHPEQSVIDRAKLTIPYGYLIKPVNQTDLKIAIELALYKYQIENEIRYNENRYRSLFNYMSSGVAVYKAIGNGEDFIIIDFNEAAENIESMKREEIIGKKVTDAFPGVKDFGLFEVLQRVYKTGTPEHYPISQYKDDRITGWRENFIYKLPSHEIVAIYDDVTEQKKAEEAVKESEAYYRTIFAHSGTATLILEEDNIISMANKECEKLSGYLRQEIEGKKRWTDFVVKEDLEQMVRYHQKRRENPNLVPKTYDFRLINKNGQIKYIHLDVGLIPGTKKSVASLIDFTQLKNAENELKHSLKEKEVINQVVMQLVEAKDTSEIYSIIGRSIKNLLPNSYVLITNSDTEMNFRIVEAFGLENKINKLNSILGTDLYKMKFPMFNFSEEDLEKFYSSRLISFDGIYDVAIRKIPRPICKIIEKVYNVGTIYCIGFSRDGIIYGSLIIVLPKGQQLENRDVIETILHQGSITLQRQTAEEIIKTSLKEKEVLLKEIHHRVKNNLQIISSLLDLQEDYVSEDATAVNVLKESQNRVLSMAMIHEMIYQSKDLSHINFADYIKNLTTNLFHSYGAGANINSQLNVEQIFLNIETAIPLGLLITELVSNSLKYAFPEYQEGILTIELQPIKKGYELIISDNGVGIPEEIDFNTESTLGLRLVKSLISQLDGTIQLERTNGTKYTITFQELKYKKRI